MKKITILAALCVAVIVYSTLSIVWGVSGIFAYRHMESEESRISKQLEDLKSIHESLSAELDALQNDRDIIVVYAHELGYVREGEQLIKLADYNSPGLNTLQTYSIGDAEKLVKQECLPDWFCKVSGIITFVLVIAAVHTKGKSENAHDFAA